MAKLKIGAYGRIGGNLVRVVSVRARYAVIKPITSGINDCYEVSKANLTVFDFDDFTEAEKVLITTDKEERGLRYMAWNRLTGYPVDMNDEGDNFYSNLTDLFIAFITEGHVSDKFIIKADGMVEFIPQDHEMVLKCIEKAKIAASSASDDFNVSEAFISEVKIESDKKLKEIKKVIAHQLIHHINTYIYKVMDVNEKKQISLWISNFIDTKVEFNIGDALLDYKLNAAIIIKGKNNYFYPASRAADNKGFPSVETGEDTSSALSWLLTSYINEGINTINGKLRKTSFMANLLRHRGSLSETDSKILKMSNFIKTSNRDTQTLCLGGTITVKEYLTKNDNGYLFSGRACMIDLSGNTRSRSESFYFKKLPIPQDKIGELQIIGLPTSLPASKFEFGFFDSIGNLNITNTIEDVIEDEVNGAYGLAAV